VKMCLITLWCWCCILLFICIYVVVIIACICCLLLCVCVVFCFWKCVRLICLGIYHKHGNDYFRSYTFLQCYFFSTPQFAMEHTVNTAFLFKKVEQATNRFTAMCFALHALQISILPEEKAVVIFIHLVSTKCEKELNTYK